MHHHITSLQLSVLAMAALLLGGCALQPKPEDLLMGAAPKPKAELEATLVTSGGFCVTLSEQGRLLTQPCDQQPNQSFSWDVGALQLAGDCLVARGEDGLGMEVCREESHQWQWQGIVCLIGRCRCAWMWRVAVISRPSPAPRRMLWRRQPEL